MQAGQNLKIRGRMPRHRELKAQYIPSFMALLFMFALVGCSPSVGNPSGDNEAFLDSVSDIKPLVMRSGQKLRVVTTTNIVFDTVHNVGNELIELNTLIPRGTDPHSYHASPGDIRKLVDADLVFISGVDLEEALHPTLSEISSDTVILSLSAGLTLQSFGEHDHEGEDEQAEPHARAGDDPHVWLDPLNVQAWTRNTADALAAADPDNADHYRKNARDYIQELESLHNWILEQVDKTPPGRRKLVTDHQALGYFAARYDFELVAALIPAYSTAAEPTARELARLVETIQHEAVSAIFVGMNLNSTLAERMAADTGIEIIPLYTGTLSSQGGPAENYLAMMKYNVEAITTSLSARD